MLADDLDKLAAAAATLLVYDSFEADQLDLVRRLREMADQHRGKVLVKAHVSPVLSGPDLFVVCVHADAARYGPTPAAAIEAVQTKLNEEGPPDASRPAEMPG